VESHAYLKDAVTNHGFIVVKGLESLTPRGHVAFTQLFGSPGAHPRRGQPPGLPCMVGTDCLVEVATNDPESQYLSDQTKADHWHADVTFATSPPTYTTLLAKTLPGGGRGDTMWACTARAYESLSPGLQEMLASLTAGKPPHHHHACVRARVCVRACGACARVRAWSKC
jgi:taurine dioxygenase